MTVVVPLTAIREDSFSPELPASACPSDASRAGSDRHGASSGYCAQRGCRDDGCADEDGSANSDGLTAAEGLPLAAILEAAVRVRDHAESQAAADQAAPDGCAHGRATSAYRPPPGVREHVVARDQTCRHPFCGQPAWRGDLDDTRPWDQGGLTCSCNLGGLCRTHHILKQLPGWTLIQPRPGTFVWTTSAGRSYLTAPDRLPS